MQLIQATSENALFSQLETQWRGQFSDYEDDFEDYQSSYREHTKRVLEACHSNYFVYLLENKGAYEAFLHVNHAQIKKLPGYTLRIMEIFLAPEYVYENITEDVMADLASSLYSGIVRLSLEDLPSETSKIFMKGIDQKYFSAFAKFFSGQQGLNVEIQGAWLVTRKVS